MPQLQVVNTSRDKPEPTGVQEFFSKLGKSYKDEADRVEIGKLLDEYKKNRNDANAWEDLQLGLEQSTVSPTKRLETQKSLNEMRKLIIEKDKALNAQVNKGILTQEEKVRQKDNLLKAGWPEYAADVYLDAPPGVKQTMEREHAELSARGFRKPLVQVPDGIDTQSQASQGSVAAASVPQASENAPTLPASSVEPQWPDIPPPPETTAAEREKFRVANQKDNIKTLEENHKKVRAIRDDQLALKRMQQLNDTGKLPTGVERWIAVNPETGDVTTLAKRLGKVNPETQAYVKEVNKFIRNAKDYYGARVTNFDLSTFLAQLPSLSNTEQGRRLILKQMQQESKLQALYANKMDEAIKHYGRNANMIDITRIVDEKIKNEEAEQIKRMDYTLEASKLLDKMAQNPKQYKDSILVEKDGNFLAIPKADLIEAESDGWSEF